MKRFPAIAMALSVVLLLAVPAMALDTAFSGDYYARGFLDRLQGSQETDAQNAYMDMRFRLKTVFQVSENLKVTTRFDALDDKVWGEVDDPGDDDHLNIDFDRAYLSFNVPLGVIDVGRMGGPGDTAFGLAFLNNEENGEIERDRLKYSLPLGDLTLMAIVGKNTDGDGSDLAQSDGDWTGYSLAGIYSRPTGSGGLLLHMDSDQRKLDMDGDGVPDMDDWNGDGIPDEDADRKEFSVNAYMDITLMDTINLLGEVKYAFGQWDYDVGPRDDIKRFAGNIEANVPLPTSSPVKVTVGVAYLSGDADYLTESDDREQTQLKTGVGADWERIWILTNDSDRGASSLGGIGNLAYGAGEYGANLTYLGVTVSPSEDLDLGVIFASSLATDVPAGWSDEHGLEWDLSVSYKVMDNLTYDLIAAFLSAGDFWKLGVDGTDVADTFSIYQKLTLKF